MGTFEPPSWAYMIPAYQGQIADDDIEKVGPMKVYKIRPNQVEAFRKEWSIAGWEWFVIYNLVDGTGSQKLPAPIDPKVKVKKNGN